MPAATQQFEAAGSRRESSLRYVVESLAALALAVLLVRSFAVEGYIISTGSMAPFLLGFHKQVVCPECRLPFAVGVPVDDSQDTSGPVACPNCGQRQIDLGHVPRNEGDQLLVQKFAYLLRRPKRWEVVVFQNPSLPTQAYVKRVIGLPSEEIQIRAGDVWIDGELARKNLAEQRSTRLAICSHQYHPAGEVESRWKLSSRWADRGHTLECVKREVEAPAEPFEGDEFERADSAGASPPLRGTSDADENGMSWVTYSGDAPKRDGSQSAAGATQLWPTDVYAYNGLAEPNQRYRVRDLMLAMQFELQSGRGEMAWSLSDGAQTFEVRLVAGERELRLFVDGVEDSGQRVKLSGSLWKRPWLVEMSLFDRQLLFALDGEVIFQQPFEPLDLPVKNGGGSAKDLVSSEPAKFGARDLHVSVSDLALYRDVYYTRGDERHGITEPYRLGSDEYFFLGDNSPVSLDSRSWLDAVVRDNMLIGKPFLVHLPSRPGRVKLGSAEWHIRVPDWGRIRYIR